MKNKHFKQYQTTVNDDKTINILDLEIFPLGNWRGFEYDEDWAKDTAIGTFESEKADGHLSSVIIGHNNDKDEKPAKGFLDNMKVDEKFIKVDLTKITPEAFESFKKREFPFRSVEIHPTNHNITALAMLGGTRPFHKMPMMEFAENGNIICNLVETQDGIKHFEAVDLEAVINRDDKLKRIRDVWWKMMNFIDQVLFDKDKDENQKSEDIKSLLEQGNELLGENVNQFKEEDVTMPITEINEAGKKVIIDEQNAQFKEEHGLTPAEAVAQNKKFKEDQKGQKKKAKEDSIKSFAEKLKDPKSLRVAPALVDEYIVPFMESLPDSAEPIKFKDGDKDVEVAQPVFFQNLIEKAVTMATEGKLQVEFDELTMGIEPEGIGAGDADVDKIDKKATDMANKYLEDGKFKTFDEGYEFAVYSIHKKMG